MFLSVAAIAALPLEQRLEYLSVGFRGCGTVFGPWPRSGRVQEERIERRRSNSMRNDTNG